MLAAVIEELGPSTFAFGRIEKLIEKACFSRRQASTGSTPIDEPIEVIVDITDVLCVPSVDKLLVMLGDREYDYRPLTDLKLITEDQRTLLILVFSI